ncbi:MULTISPECIES: alpha/beta fold hydrolase [Pseudofrankia]|uniref:alpha/beta fold hydrolase n=1 Tax=Pseudofrankia TaxID=2994363 RepID=UPI000234D331|nr:MULTISPECIES: alpha/beta fold hydrolase [Pseudofrankia]OHV39083.1 hypothetical protein BCD49_12315 [Pseudofrankia sp. EUN1h]
MAPFGVALGLGLTMPILAGACPAGPAATVPAAAAASPLAWTSCGPRTDPTSRCATLGVPLDWSDPDGPTTTLAIARHPATDQAHRIGTLLFMPGAGVSVVNQVASPSSGGLGPAEELARRFDLVGIDPRGGGLDLTLGEHDATVHSAPLDCALPFNSPTVTRFPSDQAAFAALRGRNGALAASCRGGGDGGASRASLVGQVDAVSQARDAEAVRRALGEPVLSWFAWTYASLVAQTYAHLYPDRVRAMVIDSPLDHSVPTARYVREQVLAVEESFRRFTAWCDRAPDCALHGQDVAAVYDELIARATREPIPTPGVDHPVTGEEISFMTMYALANGNLPAGHGGWADLAYGLRQAQLGNSLFGQAYPYNFGPAYYHPYRAVGCLDFRNELPAGDGAAFAELQRLRTEIRALAPHTRGAADSWDYLTGCLGWPYPPRVDARPPRVQGTPPILLVVTRHNPLAPYTLALRVADEIEHAAVARYDGDAHIAFFNSRCVADLEQRYLVTAAAPPPGTSCADGS